MTLLVFHTSGGLLYPALLMAMNISMLTLSLCCLPTFGSRESERNDEHKIIMTYLIQIRHDETLGWLRPDNHRNQINFRSSHSSDTSPRISLQDRRTDPPPPSNRSLQVERHSRRSYGAASVWCIRFGTNTLYSFHA